MVKKYSQMSAGKRWKSKQHIANENRDDAAFGWHNKFANDHNQNRKSENKQQFWPKLTTVFKGIAKMKVFFIGFIVFIGTLHATTDMTVA